MKLLVIGASGRTGRRVVEEAVSRGHPVTAFVRVAPKDRFPPEARGVIGNPMRIGDLVSHLADQDVIVSCLGQRSAADAHVLRDSAAVVLGAMGRSTVRRYIVVSQGLLFESRNPLISLLRVLLARHLTDSAAMERRLVQSEVPWNIVRPPRLTEGRQSTGYRAAINARPTGAWSMGRANLAAFLVDEAESGTYQRQIVGVAAA